MDIGIALALGGLFGSDRFEAPSWRSIRAQARAAEEVGFDLLIVEDALSQPHGDDGPISDHWESSTVLAAIAETTSRIRIGHGVVNAPYRNPGLLAKTIATLDEISGGRAFLGIGAGNTPDADYRSYGIDADPRYSRFEDTLEIVAGLLHDRQVDHEGRFHRAEARQYLVGPRERVPIVVAAGGPKMMRLAARLADGWNWWGSPHASPADLKPTIDGLERACEEVGRDPATLMRTLDLYLPVAPAGVEFDPDRQQPSEQETAEAILSFGELGVSEVRCYLHPAVPGARRREPRVGLVEGMAGVVERVHAG